jgi:hypothetical protein
MNWINSKSKFSHTNDRQTTLDKKVWLWLKKFWEFSCFYGEYKASLHSRKK